MGCGLPAYSGFPHLRGAPSAQIGYTTQRMKSHWALKI
jgi:hypothetical protein